VQQQQQQVSWLVGDHLAAFQPARRSRWYWSSNKYVILHLEIISRLSRLMCPGRDEVKGVDWQHTRNRLRTKLLAPAAAAGTMILARCRYACLITMLAASSLGV
jgi:hypothetical protein